MTIQSRSVAYGQGAMLLLVVLVGLNLRPFITGPGPVMEMIRTGTGLSYVGMSLITLLPFLLMGVGAFVSPHLQARWGTRRGLLTALALLMLGSGLRLVVPNGTALLFTALLCGMGVAFVQSVFPGIIKQQFAGRMAMVTGLYSAMIMGGGAFGAQLTPWLAGSEHHWQQALAWLALPVALAWLCAHRVLTEQGGKRPEPGLAKRLLARPRTWQLMLCFGLVNAGYSTMVTWLAPYYQQLGWSAASSAGLVSAMAVAQAIAAVGITLLARGQDRRPWLWLTLLLQLTGFAGLLLQPELAPWLWVAVCGMGLGGNFSMSLVTALDHLPQPQQAGVLTALMQGGGFLLAALGPLVVSLLLERTGTFAAGWTLHLGLVSLVLLTTLRFNPRHYGQAMAGS
ncbi:cyanate transporter [Oceanimonas doudoroffii]|uniref:MFS transporter n=1 Tax=Oceanimonas doudoroffii TaxID=84158 RepID=G5CZD8_9GAMM|nr:cyanate transporter [Oceanimonas doudoroffii]AEQ39090.1 major facilitator transporter [Oceanimonas doudoroffii]OXY82183.1 MFS transporter [Oceanimonas doudoroffii]